MSVLVSVIVSTRNGSHRLGDALDALLAQSPSYIPYEVIVVDSGSSSSGSADDAMAVVRDVERRSCGRVRYLLERRPGVPSGRNAGIALTHAPIMAFTDDEVCVAPGWLREASRLLLANPEVEYLGGPVRPRWNAEPCAWQTPAHSSPAAVDYGMEPFDVTAERGVCLVGANLFVRRTAFERVGMFNATSPQCQDLELMQRLCSAGIKGVYAPGVVAHTSQEVGFGPLFSSCSSSANAPSPTPDLRAPMLTSGPGVA